MNAKTAAERQRTLRQARADAGLVEVRGIYAHHGDHAAIKAHAAKLQRKRAKPAPASEAAHRGEKT